ncbi:MAG: STAS domain-containing protein [Deltaproteobacteria bacterium]|nr:STAS domain-containing protein [Deltaproteobacteria bacterium]
MEESNSVRIEERGSVAILDISGDVTSRSEITLRSSYERLDPEKIKGILLKFERSTYFNSEGLKVLILIFAEARKRAQKIAVAGLSGHFKKIFGMVGITKFAKIYDDEAQAVKDLESLAGEG